jgi:adenylate cyclase class IV
MNQRRVVRALKRFCSDFNPIRDRLATLGAIHVRTCRQIDYLFRVPGRETSRVKLRIEGDRQKISVYEKNQVCRRPERRSIL